MDTLGIVFVTCFLASAFVQIVRRTPLRQLHRQAILRTARRFGLVRSATVAEGLALYGEVEGCQVALLDHSPFGNERTCLSLCVEPGAEVFSWFSFAFEGSSSALQIERSELGLWPQEAQDIVWGLMRKDRLFQLCDGRFLLEDGLAPFDEQSLEDLLDEVLDLVALFRAAYPDGEALLGGLESRCLDAEAPVEQRLWALEKLLSRAADLAPHRGSISRMLQRPERQEDHQHQKLAMVLEACLPSEPLHQEALALALESPWDRIRMLGGLHCGSRGYATLFQLAAAEETSAETRIEALRYVMQRFPRHQKAQRRLLRGALRSPLLRVQCAALELYLERVTGPWRSPYPDTYSCVASLCQLLRFASTERIRQIAQELQPLLQEPFDACEGLWLGLDGVIELLQHRTYSTLRPLVRWLSKLAHPASEGLLVAWLRHPSEEIRSYAARGLGRCGTSRAIPALQLASRGLMRSSQFKNTIQRAIDRISARMGASGAGHLSFPKDLATTGSLSRPARAGALSQQSPEPHVSDAVEDLFLESPRPPRKPNRRLRVPRPTATRSRIRFPLSLRPK